MRVVVWGGAGSGDDSSSCGDGDGAVAVAVGSATGGGDGDDDCCVVTIFVVGKTTSEETVLDSDCIWQKREDQKTSACQRVGCDSSGEAD